MIIEEYIKIQKFLVRNHTKESLDYLYKRGFNDDVIKHFGIGFVKNEKIFNTPNAPNSITIPFYDMKGRIVAFFCRSINSDNIAKYIGSYNFENVYEKGKMLYNLYWVIRSFYNKKVFVVEGQLDAISLYQVGFGNVVAVIGNQMTDIQQEIIYRYFDKVYLICDGDKAGDNLIKIKPKLKKLIIFKVKINIAGCKDVNDMLQKGLNIKKYIKDNRELLK